MRAITSYGQKEARGLNDAESAYLKAILSGKTLAQAATLSGFSPEQTYNVLQRPHVAAAIYSACKVCLTGQLAPKSLLKLDKLLDSNNERVALDAAKTVIQHAYRDDTEGKGGRTKPLSEMSQQELREHYERARLEMTNRSTKVLDASDSSDNAQGDAQTDAKSLDILD